jgi:hypothetical protein
LPSFTVRPVLNCSFMYTTMSQHLMFCEQVELEWPTV